MLLRVALVLIALSAVQTARAQEPVRWTLASTFPSTLTQLGTLGKRLETQIALVSDGAITLDFNEPGSPIPVQEIFDAVGRGDVDAGWSNPGYWAEREPALALFAAVPFGPPADEYLAWFYFGGGREFFEEIYQAYNIHSVLCGVNAPEALGWFREPLETVDDLRGLEMRFFGLGARVLEKLGATTRLLVGDEIIPQLSDGSIDATEFSMPAIDIFLGFHKAAKNYYFPGWHRQSTLFDLTINLDKWNSLTDTQKAQIETVCGDNVRFGMAEGEAIQIAALKELRDTYDVELRRLPPDILNAAEEAWDEVVADLSAENEKFAAVWTSFSAFREDYKLWKDLGYLR